jgi:hypothetical protein
MASQQTLDCFAWLFDLTKISFTNFVFQSFFSNYFFMTFHRYRSPGGLTMYKNSSVEKMVCSCSTSVCANAINDFMKFTKIVFPLRWLLRSSSLSFEVNSILVMLKDNDQLFTLSLLSWSTACTMFCTKVSAINWSWRGQLGFQIQPNIWLSAICL